MNDSRIMMNLLRLTAALQHLTHFVTRIMKLPRDLTNAHPVPMSPTYASVFVHRKHP